MSSPKKIYLVQYVIQLNDHEKVLQIGIFSTLERAEAAAKKLITQPGFRDNPKIHHDGCGCDNDTGFHINKRTMDTVSWDGGFEWD